MKIELTIKVDYLPSWGVYEGIRELLQNGKDAETEHSALLTVRYRKDSNTVVIENEGCTLPYEALLLGHTTKAGRPELIGKFGEGLKLGILALVRKGLPVKIRSGGEVWVPSIQRSEKFKADVLVFDIQGGRKEENRVAVEIGSLGEGAWEQMKDCFLFLGTTKADEVVRTPSGSLLLAERYHGKIYVKGIFVSNNPSFSYGYDFADADLDRDRRMLSKYDLDFRTQCVWREALGRRPDLIENFGALLDKEAADVGGFDDWAATQVPDAAMKVLVMMFQKRYGDDALPVGNLSESAEIEHLGKKGIICPKPLKAILECGLGNVMTNKAKLREEVTKTYGWHSLSSDEKEHLQGAITLVSVIEPVTINEVDVTDFRDPAIRGMFKDGRILLDKKILADRNLCLRVLVHEVAHRAGGDGEKGHVQNIERIWAGIVANLMSKSDH